MEKNAKKKGQETLILSIIGIAAGISFVGGFGFGESYKTRRLANDRVVTVDSSVVAAGFVEERETLGYDEYNIVYDDSNNNYSFIFDSYAGLDDSYVEARYGEDKDTVELVRNYLDTGISEEHTLVFDGKVVDAFVAGFGNDMDKDAMFFVLEDGSLEYLLIRRAINNNDYRTFKVDEVQNVVKHYNANSCNDETGACTRTVLVQTMDGSIYDLLKIVG